MATIIKYANELLNPITESQLSMLQKYNKLIYEDGLLKVIEFYGKTRSINYKRTNYFLNSSENKNFIIDQFTDSTKNEMCLVYFNKQSLGDYNLWDWESYSMDRVLKLKGKHVFDKNNKIILSINYDLDTNAIKSAYKYYYENLIEGEMTDHLLRFSYDNGELDSISDIKSTYGYIQSIDLEQFLADIEFSQVQFPWHQHPYYHSLYPLLPQSEYI